MKKVLFLTPGIHPLNGGRELGSYGYCVAIGEVARLRVISLLDDGVSEADAARDAQGGPFEAKYLHGREGEGLVQKLLYHPLTTALARFAYNLPLYRRVYGEAADYIRREEPDAAVIDHLLLYAYFGRLRRDFPRLTLVYHSHNVEWRNTFAQQVVPLLNAPRTPLRRLRALLARARWRTRRAMELKLIRRADYTLCVSEADRQTLLDSARCGGEKLLLAKPLIRFSLVKAREDMERFGYRLLIVGSMGWYPNRNGVAWFLREVFSPLLALCPRYQLYLVGGGITEDLARLCAAYGDRVVVTGAVESTEPYFELCDLGVIPVFEGTGAKIKVLESIARGLPSVCSAFAAKDYGIDGEMSVARTAAEFAEAIRKLSDSSSLREERYERMAAYREAYYRLSPAVERLFTESTADKDGSAQAHADQA